MNISTVYFEDVCRLTSFVLTDKGREAVDNLYRDIHIVSYEQMEALITNSF